MTKQKKCKRCPQNATFNVVLDGNKFAYLCGNCLYHAIRNDEVISRYPNEEKKRDNISTKGVSKS